MIYRKLALAGAVTLALATTVNAQDASYLDIERPANSPYQLRASDLLGMDVENFNGDEIGEIDDLIISSDNTPTAVISVGGFLGLGDKLVAIPYNELKFDSEREDVVYNATEEQLKSLVERHAEETNSIRAREILDNWETEKGKFLQVCPKEMLPLLKHPIAESGDLAAMPAE